MSPLSHTLLTHPILPQSSALLQDIAQAREAKEQRRLEAVHQQEYAQLQECTFHPEVHHGIPHQPTHPVTVRGLGKYLQRQL